MNVIIRAHVNVDTRTDFLSCDKVNREFFDYNKTRVSSSLKLHYNFI